MDRKTRALVLMASLTDLELWQCANEVLKQHGNEAAHFVAERIGALALQGDIDGIATWKAIAWRIDSLREGGPGTRAALN